MVGGHLACGVSSRGLTVRVGPEGMVKALRDPRARPLVIGGRATAAFVVVESDGYHDDEMLRGWLEMTLRHLATSPSR